LGLAAFLVKEAGNRPQIKFPGLKNLFRAAYEQNPVFPESLGESAIQSLFGFFGKIYNHIAAQDQVKFPGKLVNQQVMFLKPYHLLYIENLAY
jgi:hypothetical protein